MGFDLHVNKCTECPMLRINLTDSGGIYKPADSDKYKVDIACDCTKLPNSGIRITLDCEEHELRDFRVFSQNLVDGATKAVNEYFNNDVRPDCPMMKR